MFYDWLLIICSLIGWNRRGCGCRLQKVKIFLGVFDFKRRCTEWSVYDIKVPREPFESIGSSALLLLSRYFDVIHWPFCAAPLKVERAFYLWRRLPRSTVLVEAAGFWVHEHRLRSASAPPAKPLAVCAFRMSPIENELDTRRHAL